MVCGKFFYVFPKKLELLVLLLEASVDLVEAFVDLLEAFVDLGEAVFDALYQTDEEPAQYGEQAGCQDAYQDYQCCYFGVLSLRRWGCDFWGASFVIFVISSLAEAGCKVGMISCQILLVFW